MLTPDIPMHRCRLPLRRPFALALALLATLGLARAVPAQGTAASVNAAPLVLGESFTMVSSRLGGETRRINVYRPPAWGVADTVPRPVLYMPDGGAAEDFVHVAGLLQVLTGNGSMRPFLLVGIENTERRRDMTGPTTVASDRKIAPRVGGSAAFRAFIRDELIPEIGRRYRTTGERAIVGESLAGLFVVETYLQEPGLFDTYIALDPSVWWNDSAMVKAAPRTGSAPAGARLWMATSSEPTIARLTAEFAASLRRRGVSEPALRLVPMPEETHATIYHPAAMRAFRALFAPPR